MAIFGILVLSAFYPALQIRTDFNLENFFPEKDPVIENYSYLQEEFGSDDNIIMVGFENDSLFTEKVLRDLQAITDSAVQIPHISDVQSLWSAQRIHNDPNKLTFEPYLDNDSLFTEHLEGIKSDLIKDPIAEGFLINHSGDVTAFYLTIEKGANNYESREKIAEQLNNILRPYQQKYDFKISGIPHYRNQYVHYLNQEMVFYIALSSVLIIFLLWGLYRSFTGVAIPILIVWITILFTLAIMQLSGGYFEVMSSTLAPILLCVGIADSIHMISKYDDALSQGFNRNTSIKEMISTLGKATFLTSITTAIGFGTLVTSEIVPMKRFGIYTALGVMIAFTVTILLLPSLLSVLKTKHIFKNKSTFFFNYLDKILRSVNQFNRTHYKKITIVTFLGSLLISSGIYLVKVNGKVFDELGENTEPIQHARFFEENLSPPFPVEFIIDTGEENGITDPNFIRGLENFTSYLKSQKETARVISFNTLLKQIHLAMAPGKAKIDSLPGTKSLISQYLLLFEMNNENLLQKVTDFSYQKIRIATQVYDVGSYRINQLRDEFQTRLKSQFPEADITTTGTTILSASINNKIVNSLFTSIALAFVLISIIMAFLFRNIRMVFISLIPNILPLLITAGVMGFTGIDIKSSTAVIFTIAFGIAVDDSIHYLARLRVEMRRGKSLEEALSQTTRRTGKAIIVTSLILLAGFGSLLTSVFTHTVQMGLLVGLTIFSALIADLFLLPSLFYWIKPKFTFEKQVPEPVSKSDRVPDQQAV